MVGDALVAYLSGRGPSSDTREGRAFLASLSEESPVIRVNDAFVASAGAQSSRDLLTDPALTVGSVPTSMLSGLPEVARLFGGLLSMLDGAEHTRLRHVIAPFFSARSSGRLHDDIAALIAATWPSPDRDGEPFDLVTQFADVVPVAISARLLGLPDGDVDMLRQWAWLIRDHLGRFDQDAALRARVGRALADARDYAERAFASADTGVLHAIATARSGGDINADEAFGLFVLLLINGLETLTQALVRVVASVAVDTDAMAAVRAEPADAIRVFRRTLMARPPLRNLARRARCPASVGGRSVPAGAVAVVVLAAAVADAERGRAAERLPGDLVYGHGPHVCLGMHLADLAGAELLRFLAGRYLRLDVAPGAVAHPSPAIDGYRRFPVVSVPLPPGSATAAGDEHPGGG